MDRFGGRVAGCSWISLDRFDIHASAFFLSHCHTDHMSGLHSDQFSELLCSESAFFYCHTITKLLLGSMARYRRLLDYTVAKEYDQKFTIRATGKEDDEGGKLLAASSADVTFLDARHMPGSVMFVPFPSHMYNGYDDHQLVQHWVQHLWSASRIEEAASRLKILFEFVDGYKVLYTSDYRLSKEDWISCNGLKDPVTSSGFKRIDAFYFDSTFCRGVTRNIPTRKQSCALCVKMVREWLEKDPENKVLIWCGRYGHEYLLKSIWEQLHLKSHVTVGNYRIYSKIDYLADCVTPVARGTRVHACTIKPDGTGQMFYESNQNVIAGKKGSWNFKQKISACWQCRPDCSNVRVIKPSAIWFARRNENNAIGYDNNRFCRLLYSGHSSLTEVEDAISLLRPVHVFPNTVDKRSRDFADKLIKYFSCYCSGRSMRSPIRCPSSNDTGNKTIDVITLSNTPERNLKRKSSSDIAFEDDDCEVLDEKSHK